MESQVVHNNANGDKADLAECLIPAKKLKQVRLPFQALDPKLSQTSVTSGTELSVNQKKRRLSDKDSHHRPSKSPKMSADSERENHLSGENVKLSKKPDNKSACSFKVTDDEISSNCEPEVHAISKKKIFNKKCKSNNILENFVKKEHAQVPEVSILCGLVDPVALIASPANCISGHDESLENENCTAGFDEDVDLYTGAKAHDQNCGLETCKETSTDDISALEQRVNVENESRNPNDQSEALNDQNSSEVCVPTLINDTKSIPNKDVQLDLSLQQQPSEEDDTNVTATNADLDNSIPEESPFEGDTLNLSATLNENLTDSAKKRKTKKQEERERMKQEKLKKLQEMKEEKFKQKELMKQQKEKANAEKEEKKKKILKEKMEEKRKRDEEKQKKEEERKKKEEERRMKEDEKKAKDEEKRQIEEMMQKKKEKVKMQFASFFVKKSNVVDKEDPLVDTETCQFKPFQLTKGMYLAPITRSILEDLNIFDEIVAHQNHTSLYIEEMNTKSHMPKKGKRTCPVHLVPGTEEKFDEDIEVLDEIADDSSYVPDENVKLKLPRPKLLQFHENQRPPYWGSFRKTSKNIRSRNPFGQDKDLLDYEVDSDDEWEEEEPGESLHGSDDDKESEDDYDEDGEFMVPHGYLSADEEDEDPETANNPETQKQKLKLRAEEFQMDLKRSSQRHLKKPRIIGCVFIKSFDMSVELESNDRLKLLQSYKTVLLDDCPIPSTFTLVPSNHDNADSNNASSTGNSPEDSAQKSRTPNSLRKSFPEEAMPYLIRLVHANSNSRPNLATEFKEFWRQHCLSKIQVTANSESTPNNSLLLQCELSKRQIELTIQKLSSWCRYPNPEIYNRLCWVVTDEHIQKYSVGDLSVPNKWYYVSEVMSRKAAAAAASMEQAIPSPVNITPKVNRITKFVQPMSPQISNLTENTSKSSTPNIAKTENLRSIPSVHSVSVKTVAVISPGCSKDLFPESDKTQKSSKTLVGPMEKFLKSVSPTVAHVDRVKTPQPNVDVEVVAIVNRKSPNEIGDPSSFSKSVKNIK